MSNPGSPVAILVSHGQPSDPSVGQKEILRLAQVVSGASSGLDVQGATLAQEGALEEAAQAALAAPIYPMFMVDGYFTRSALPRRLTGHAGKQLPPFGTDPDLPALAARWVTEVCAQQGFAVTETTLVICAHGSGRSPYAALDTQIFVDRLRAAVPCRAFRTGFVEQAPYLSDALAGVEGPAICLPFFATKRGHVLEDLPEAVAQAQFSGVVLDPIGLHEDVPKLIAARLRAAL